MPIRFGAPEDYTRPELSKKNCAPEPVDASLFNFEYKQQLETQYRHFVDECNVKEAKPFYFKDVVDADAFTDSLTSFLCTDEAMSIFAKAAEEFKSIELKHPTFVPKRSDREDAFYSNIEALEHARKFLAHAVNQGNRGTPHR